MTPEELQNLEKKMQDLQKEFDLLIADINKEKRDRRIRFVIGFTVGLIVGSVIIKLVLNNL